MTPPAGLAFAFPAPAAAPFQALAADAAGLPDLAGIAAGSAALFTLRGIERWREEQARAALGRIGLALRPGGVLRVATPDLDSAVQDYLLGAGAAPDTLSRGARFNLWRRSLDVWRVYNEEDLAVLLGDAGFADVRRFMPGSGSERAFWDLDTGEPGLLVVESRRTKETRV